MRLPPSPGRVRLGHLIELEQLRVEVQPGLEGPALLDRLAELNRRRFLPVIEELLEEFDDPLQRITIARLEVRLGSFTPDDLGGAEAMLRARLRAALRSALAHGEALQERESRGLVGALEHYLLHGVWPYARAVQAALPADLLAQLIAEDPLALVAMLRRRGSSDVLLRRLVRQMPHALLAELLRRLEPVHAGYVLTYMIEVGQRHAAERLVSATPDAMADMLWTIVLRDALQESGLQANRKAFLRRLLGELARRGGTTLEALVAQLRRGLPPMLARRRAPGSLVAVLGELIDEEPALLTGEAGTAELAAILAQGNASRSDRRRAARLARIVPRQQLRWLLARMTRDGPAQLAQAIAGALQPGVVVDALDEANLPTLIAALEELPGEAGRHMASRLRTELSTRAAVPSGLRGEKKAPANRAVGAHALAMLAAALAEGLAADVRLRLAGAMATDPLAARRLLRSFAAADTARFLALLHEDPPEQIVEQLVAPHLHACLVGLARATACGAAEWRVLIETAAAADDGDLPETVLERALRAVAHARSSSPAKLRAQLRRALATASASQREMLHALALTPASRAARLTARQMALEQLAWISGPDAGLGIGERAAALARLLPRLAGVEPEALRARLSALADPRHLLSLLGVNALLRLAPLLRPREAEPLRGLAPAELADFLAEAVTGIGAAASAGTTDLPLASARLANMETRALERLSRTALLRRLSALAPRGSRAAARVRRSLARASDPDAEARRLILELGPRRDPDRASRAPVPSGSGGMPLPIRILSEREPVGGAYDDRFIAGPALARSGGASSSTVRVRPRSGELRLAALVRTRPFAALRAAAQRDPRGQPRLVALLEEPEAAPLLFASFHPAERDRCTGLARLLTGRLGRLAVSPAKVAAALARAAAARDWRSGGDGFAAEWMRQLIGLASLAEQAALRRLSEPLLSAPQAEASSKKEAGAIGASGPLARARALLGLPARAPASAIARALGTARARGRLARELSEAELVQLLSALAPTGAAGLLHAAERIAAARRAGVAPLPRTMQWEAILAAAIARDHMVARLANRLLDGGDGIPAAPPAAAKRIEAALAAALEGMRDAPLRIALDLRERERKRRRSEVLGDCQDAPGTAIHVGNAGLVLASAYLPRLFQSLDYVEPDVEGGWRWIDPACQGRAVHLLQWLVDERTDAPEPALALNKLLCGLAPSENVPAGIEPSEQELRMARTLLATIRAGWPALAESSIEALRETFLQREGRLTRSDNGWGLEVERKVIDILLDQLLWGYSTILHSWMEAPLNVQWR